ncbi:MAG: C4-dicarboxylate transporter/malic acid transport protein [Rhizobacter sp.]|nr:C4-dicarboxylate transporter/malic acid transport protein [Rhizobacter sp.]
MTVHRIFVPTSFFGMAVGLLALANAWRVAVRLWALPTLVPQLIADLGLAVWAALLLLTAWKWAFLRDEALAEWRHPVQSSFAALAGVATMLAATALLPVARPLATVVFAVAIVGQLALGLSLHGRFWQGGRPPESVTAAIYLPAVAQNFVAGTASAAFGWSQLAMLFFGAGLLSWLAIESLVLSRAATQDAMPPALRPILGIQLAPPVVGGVTWLNINGGVADVFAFILLGYGLYQALLLMRLLPWIGAQGFAPSYWAFSFGVAALPTLAMLMVERGATGLVADLAPALFVAANVVFAMLVGQTLRLWLRGGLLPARVVIAATPTR